VMQDNCSNCEHFDGDAFCSLPEKEKLIAGHIREPEYVVCSRHEESESSQHMKLLDAIDAEAGAEEMALYQKYPRY
jgi:hypothetical protein